MKKTPKGTLPATTTTISQSTAAKRKQLACVLDGEDEGSHVLPKGLLPLHSFLIYYNQIFFPASASKKPRVELSDNEIDEVLPISMIFFFLDPISSLLILTYHRKTFNGCSKRTRAARAISI